ncbi:MAG: UDP-N-acetylmuramoyl-tripeptide--D-alanyl-D-alanine ligase [Myxococcota bacterium]|jgi:UDP-N-acetylmuramoyl-tripeptide--D-alanyl-D-alanine ligase
MIRTDFIQRTLRTEVVGARCEQFESVSTDSRSDSANSLFFALKGPTFNGHDFLAAAMERGSIGAVIERDHLERARVMMGRRLQKFSLIPVSDTQVALQELAAAYRRTLGTIIVAITGSNGKTTTKEMIASILSEKGKVHKTEGNLNNLIGLPLMVFRIMPDHVFAVLEMGMNQPGEIAALTQIAMPDVAIVTNAHPAHLEGLGSVDAIADEKFSIFAGLREGGTAVINAEDPALMARAAGHAGRRLFYGAKAGCDTRLLSSSTLGMEGQVLTLDTGHGAFEARIPHLGRHNALNATAAAAAAVACGASDAEIAEGLQEVQVVSRRLEHELIAGVHVLNDVYNANPKSMDGALETLVSIRGQGRAFAVLGDMLELGPGSRELHAELGRAAARYGVSGLIVLGAESGSTVGGAVEAGMDAALCFKAIDAADAAWVLRKRVRPGDWVLVKGSRGMKMEQVIEQFRQAYSGGLS